MKAEKDEEELRNGKCRPPRQRRRLLLQVQSFSFCWMMMILNIVHKNAHSYALINSPRTTDIHGRCRGRIHSYGLRAQNGKGNSKRVPGISDDQDIDVDSVSDAEALLACRSYLQRRKRMSGGRWKQHEVRKRMKEISTSEQPLSFWEDSSELVYFRREFQRKDLSIEEGLLDTSIDDDDDSETLFGQPERSMFESTDDLEYTSFTSYPTEPSPTRIKMQEAKKRTWSDPEWKNMWYERRWGNKSKSNNQRKKGTYQKQLEDRIRALPPGLLGSPELASMTDEEISHAIRSYITSRQKRVASTAKTRERQKKALTPPPLKEPLPRDSLLTVDENAMKEAQRKRSEQARRYYQVRLQNQQKAQDTKKSTETTRRSKHLSSDKGDSSSSVSDATVPPLDDPSSPQSAIARIEVALENDQNPTVEDIQIILEPKLLRKRKQLLLQILRDRFQTRGKCIPVNPEDPDSKLEFATQVSLRRLGDTVLRLLKEAS